MLKRQTQLRLLRGLLKRHPVVGILGPRQVGKTTLARSLGKAVHFDLENDRDLGRLADPLFALEGLKGLVVIDEVQRRPGLFTTLRVLADRPRTPARFLVLGSASPQLLRQTSESLAGRIAYHALDGFGVDETGIAAWPRLWLRGGFPRSYLAKDEPASMEWRRHFIRDFLERDLPQLGSAIPAATLKRFWGMLAHYHAQTWNGAEFARSFGISEMSVRRYLDLLAGTYMVRLLPAWHENLGKRQVKAPKVYLADTGILHSLLDIRDAAGLETHPKSGASWEGFALDLLRRHLGAEWDECHYWATHNGAELDLLVVRGRQRRGFEFKRTSAPAATPSMHVALKDLKLDSLEIIHAGKQSFALGPKLRAVALPSVLNEVTPLAP